MSRILGDNSHGNENELNLVNALNDKNFNQLNTNLKEFIKYIVKTENIKINSNTIIKARYESNNKLKQDFYLKIDKVEVGVSLKMGTGNSVHQEKCEDFIKFIREECNATNEVCDAIRIFIWADGTTDGSGSKKKDKDGNIIARFTAKEFRDNEPEKRKLIQDFFTKNEEKLIRRFLFEGKYGSKVDYIYHGTVKNGSWISAKSIIDYQIKNSVKYGNSCLVVGKMTIQAWNISKKGTDAGEKKRGELQAKYASMVEDFNNLMLLESENIGTFLGDREEFSLSKVMNSNKSSKLWKNIECGDNENYYLVKVEKRALSKLSGQKVYAKSDAFIIKADISDKFLLEREYLIGENDLDLINYDIVENTGISIKIKDSDNFSIHKFTKDSFIKFFYGCLDNSLYVFAGLLLYSKNDELFKNETILKDLEIEEKEFNKFCLKDLKIKNGYNNNRENIDMIRRECQNILRNIINSNFSLKSSIFTGRGLYDEPYYCDYILRNREIIKFTKEYIEELDFQITTGSKRSSGKYTVVIKNKR